MQWGGLDFDYPLNPAQLEVHLGRAERTHGGHMIFTVRENATGVAIGHGELTAINHRHRTCRISRVLVGPSAHRNRGLGAQTMHALLYKAFVELRLHRVELAVFDFNDAAIRCYEKIGFVHEGKLRESVCFEGEHWHTLMMSILEQEWARV